MIVCNGTAKCVHPVSVNTGTYGVFSYKMVLVFSQEILGVLQIIQGPFFSVPAPPRCGLRRLLGDIEGGVLDAHRTCCKQDLLHNGSTRQTGPHGRSEREGQCFGLAGD